MSHLAERLEDTLQACNYSVAAAHSYLKGRHKPHYPMPAVPIKIEYCFEPYNWTGNGVFVCERGAIVAGAYQDGMPID